MKRNASLVVVTMFAITFPLSCAIAGDVESLVLHAGFGKAVKTAEGRDGRKIVYPSDWTTAQGRDGRIIAHPVLWQTAEGKDGRKIAHPVLWQTAEGRDGRRIVHPVLWKTAEGPDGRKVAYPVLWKSDEGKDGRVVAYPATWKTEAGSDKRLVPIPSETPVSLLIPDATEVARIVELADDDADDAVLYAIYRYVNERDVGVLLPKPVKSDIQEPVRPMWDMNLGAYELWHKWYKGMETGPCMSRLSGIRRLIALHSGFLQTVPHGNALAVG